MKNYIYWIFIFPIFAFSQNEKELLNFKKGIGMTSPDSLYQLNLRFRMQNRMQFLSESGGKTSYGAEVRRLRLRFEGFVLDPKLTYTLQLSFTSRDVAQSPNHLIRDAVLYYTPNKNWQFGFGQAKLPGNRQRSNSSGAWQFTDGSINNSRFNIDRDFGLFANYQNRFSEHFYYHLKTAISTGEGRNYSRNSEGLAYTGRLELYPLGKFSNNGAFFEGDLEREQTPKLYLGASYQFNHRALKSQGQTGNLLFEERDLQSFFADAHLKYRGWAMQLAYMNRNAQNPITTNGTENQYVYVGEGWDTQLSYLFSNNYEIAMRYSKHLPSYKISEFQPKINEVSFALNKYLRKHTCKVQAEITHSQKNHFDMKKSDWQVRFQVEIGI